MGQLANRRRVILPVYKPTDHTPSVYKDPYSDRVIPVGYFLNNLDSIGPLHWNNSQTADHLLRVVACDEIDFWCEYFDQCFHQSFNQNLQIRQNYAQQQQLLIPSKSSMPISTKCHKDTNALDVAVLTNCVNYMMHSYNQWLEYHFQYLSDHNMELPLSPPESPTSPNVGSYTNAPNHKPTIADFSRSTPYYFYSHTLVLASQSGLFNQLLGPINHPASPLSPTPSSNCPYPQSPIHLTVPIPHPDCFEPILHWLYHHDDDLFLDVITPDNFIKFYENIKFLKLGKEAFDILDSFIEEAEEFGLEITAAEEIIEFY